MSHYQYDKEALFMTYKRWLLLIVINTIITLRLLISFVGYTSVVRTRQDFLSLLAIVALHATYIAENVLFTLFYVIHEFHRFLHRGKARLSYDAVT